MFGDWTAYFHHNLGKVHILMCPPFQMVVLFIDDVTEHQSVVSLFGVC
jgi:hypothetical protein